MKITVFTHFFRVTGHDKKTYPLVKAFAFKHVEYDYRPVIMAKKFRKPIPKPKIKKIYAAFTADKRQFHFHRNSLEGFIEHLKVNDFKGYEVEYIDLYPKKEIGLKLKEGYVAREDQEPLIEYLVDDGYSKILNLQTGFGKTFCALAGAVRMNGKILISIETRFFNLWLEALGDGKKKILDIDSSNELIFVQGTQQLKLLMQQAVEGLLDHIKVIVVAARTLNIYLEAYERFNGDLEGSYSFPPEQFYEALEVVTRIKDEVHLNLYQNFFEELHMHVHKSFSLSATLEDGTYRDKVLAILFPKKMRSPEVEYLQYISSTALMYTLAEPWKARFTQRGSTDYNHNVYEQYIMKDKKLRDHYFTMVYEWVDSEYLRVRQDKQRAVIFFESTEMATAAQAYLQNRCKGIEITRYCASLGDEYQVARNGDLLITTPKSFGTGFDVEDLICTLMTNSINSQNTNLQILGRLRVLKNYKGLTPRFYYFVCTDIPKQMDYHETKLLQFSGKVKDQKVIFLNNTI